MCTEKEYGHLVPLLWLTSCWPSTGWAAAPDWLGSRKGTSECQGNTGTDRGSTLVQTVGREGKEGERKSEMSSCLSASVSLPVNRKYHSARWQHVKSCVTITAAKAILKTTLRQNLSGDHEWSCVLSHLVSTCLQHTHMQMSPQDNESWGVMWCAMWWGNLLFYPHRFQTPVYSLSRPLPNFRLSAELSL